MSGGFVKIYGSKLLKSTLWLESIEARLLFIGMLAEADADGVVDIPSVKALAHRMNMTVEQTESGLAVLESPDPESRTEEMEGRRVYRDGRVWRVVNYDKYREMRTENQERDRIRKLRERAQTGSDASVARSDERGRVQDERDAATEAEAEAEKKEEIGTSPVAQPSAPAAPALPGFELTAETAQPAPKLDPVFAHWMRVMGKDPARTKLTGDRRSKLKARRREGYTDALLCQAIDGARRSDFHMGKNDRGELYNDLATILKDGKTVDGHIARLGGQASPPPAPGQLVRNGQVIKNPAALAMAEKLGRLL